MSCFQFVVHKFSELLHTIKTSTHGHGCSQKLTRQSKFMNDEYIQYPLKWPLKTPEGIQHLDLRSETLTVLLQCFGFAQIVQAFTYPAVRSCSRFSTKIYIWICWDVVVENNKRFFGLNNCLGKLVQTAIIKDFSVRWRKYATGKMDVSGVTLQLCDQGCTWC